MDGLIMEPDQLTFRANHSEGSFQLASGPVNWSISVQSRSWRPPTDVYETEESIVVKVEIAGMTGHEFSIHLSANTLSISGTRPPQTGRCAYYQMEIHSGDFLSEVELPSLVDSDQLSADYQDGYLIVTVKKVKARNIQVIQNK